MVDTELIEGHVERAREIEEIAAGRRWIRSPERKHDLGLFVSRKECGTQPDVCLGVDVNNGPDVLAAGQLGGHLQDVRVPDLKGQFSEAERFTALNDTSRFMFCCKTRED